MDKRKARKLLEERRRDLETVVRAATEQGSLDEAQTDSAGELSSHDQHPADLATDTLEREIDHSVRQSAEARIEDIDRALKRIDEGTYGICPVCDKAIDPARLEAKPEAEFCVDHQPQSARAD